MPGHGEQPARAGQLHDLAHVHHRDPLAEVLDDGQVVGDEQVGEVVVLLEILQQLQDLRLHRHVQGGYRLVGDDELRHQRQGAGDRDALALPARERVRIARHVDRVQAHHAQQLGHAVLHLAPAAERPVDDERLGDRLRDGHARIQRRIGILKDHAHLGHDLLELAPAQIGNVDRGIAAVRMEEHLAGGGLHRPLDAAPGGGLSAPALAHQRQRLSRVHGEAHVVDRLDDAGHLPAEPAGALEVLDEVPDLQQRLPVGHHAPPPAVPAASSAPPYR